MQPPSEDEDLEARRRTLASLLDQDTHPASAQFFHGKPHICSVAPQGPPIRDVPSHRVVNAASEVPVTRIYDDANPGFGGDSYPCGSLGAGLVRPSQEDRGSITEHDALHWTTPLDEHDVHPETGVQDAAEGTPFDSADTDTATLLDEDGRRPPPIDIYPSPVIITATSWARAYTVEWDARPETPANTPISTPKSSHCQMYWTESPAPINRDLPPPDRSRSGDHHLPEYHVFSGPTTGSPNPSRGVHNACVNGQLPSRHGSLFSGPHPFAIPVTASAGIHRSTGHSATTHDHGPVPPQPYWLPPPIPFPNLWHPVPPPLGHPTSAMGPYYSMGPHERGPVIPLLPYALHANWSHPDVYGDMATAAGLGVGTPFQGPLPASQLFPTPTRRPVEPPLSNSASGSSHLAAPASTVFDWGNTPSANPRDVEAGCGQQQPTPWTRPEGSTWGPTWVVFPLRAYKGRQYKVIEIEPTWDDERLLRALRSAYSDLSVWYRRWVSLRRLSYLTRVKVNDTIVYPQRVGPGRTTTHRNLRMRYLLEHPEHMHGKHDFTRALTGSAEYGVEFVECWNLVRVVVLVIGTALFSLAIALIYGWLTRDWANGFTIASFFSQTFAFMFVLVGCLQYYEF